MAACAGGRQRHDVCHRFYHAETGKIGGTAAGMQSLQLHRVRQLGNQRVATLLQPAAGGGGELVVIA